MSEIVNSYKVVFLLDTNFGSDRFEGEDRSSKCAAVARGCVLKVLAYLASRVRYQFKNLQWGFLFYNSQTDASFKCCSGFKEFETPHFEDFENQVDLEFEKYHCSKISHHKDGPDTNVNESADKLRDALREIVCRFQWDQPDISSPVKKPNRTLRRTRSMLPESFSSSHGDTHDTQKHNLVVLLSNCSQSVSEFLQMRKVRSPVDLLSCFMPSHLHDKFHRECRIKMYWIYSDQVV